MSKRSSRNAKLTGSIHSIKNSNFFTKRKKYYTRRTNRLIKSFTNNFVQLNKMVNYNRTVHLIGNYQIDSINSIISKTDYILQTYRSLYKLSLECENGYKVNLKALRSSVNIVREFRQNYISLLQESAK